MSDQTTSLEKGLAVLHILAEAEGGLTVAEVARRIGLNRTTAYRLCEVLERSGWVQLSGDGGRPSPRRVDLGPGALGLGILAAGKYDPEDRLKQTIEQLAHQVNETVHAGALDGIEVIHVARALPDDGPRIAARLGAREPAHVTALGKAMLATLSRDEVLRRYRQEELVGQTPAAITTRSRLLEDLEGARELGYAVDNQESHPGVFCIAAPVFTRSGTAPYAISVTSLPIHLEGERLPVVAEAVRAAAERATRAQGGSVPDDWAVSSGGVCG